MKKKKVKPAWKSIRRFWSRKPETQVQKNLKKELEKRKGREKVEPTEEP